MNESKAAKHSLLEELVVAQGLSLQPMYTNHDVAKIFGVDVRTIQNWVASDRLQARDLPGRWRFLSQDLEEFIRSSRKARRSNAPRLAGLAA